MRVSMEFVNILEAKNCLPQLIAQVAKGESFIITKAGKPVALLSAIESPAPCEEKRLGFLVGQCRVPDDFDRLGQSTIDDMFGC